MSIEVIFVSLVVLGAVIWIVFRTVANHRRSEFQKIFGVMPANRHATLAARSLGQTEVDKVMDEFARKIIRVNERRPAEDKGMEILDIWEEEHALILMRFEEVKLVAKKFGYHIKWDPR